MRWEQGYGVVALLVASRGRGGGTVNRGEGIDVKGGGRGMQRKPASPDAHTHTSRSGPAGDEGAHMCSLLHNKDIIQSLSRTCSLVRQNLGYLNRRHLGRSSRISQVTYHYGSPSSKTAMRCNLLVLCTTEYYAICNYYHKYYSILVWADVL